jgi:IS5 family transposase
MGFVNLLVALEEELDQRLDVKVFLGDIMANEPDVTTIADLRELLGRVVQKHKIPGA